MILGVVRIFLYNYGTPTRVLGLVLQHPKFFLRKYVSPLITIIITTLFLFNNYFCFIYTVLYQYSFEFGFRRRLIFIWHSRSRRQKYLVIILYCLTVLLTSWLLDILLFHVFCGSSDWYYENFFSILKVCFQIYIQCQFMIVRRKCTDFFSLRLSIPNKRYFIRFRDFTLTYFQSLIHFLKLLFDSFYNIIINVYYGK